LSDARLYRWLLSIGIHPAKSLTLGAIDVPSEFFVAFLRGLLDGDGSIYRLRHRPTTKAQPQYWYDRLWTYFASASRAHIDWLQTQLRTKYGIAAYVETTVRPNRHPFYRLKLGNTSSVRLLAMLYADPDAPALARKREKWTEYLQRTG